MIRERVVPLPAGKIAEHTFLRVIEPRLGAHRTEVLVGPRHGADAGIVDLGGGRVMALSTDPFFVSPEFGWKRAAWFAIHIVASDLATSGIRPAYCAIDLNLPLEMTDGELSEMWAAVDETCKELGMAVVTGHTGRYEGCAYPMLGGATVIGVGSLDTYVTTSMASVDDAVILTKGAAIETTAVFGVTFPDRIAAACGDPLARAAADLFYSMSVVDDALAAVEVGTREHGVTSMHDATERGIFGGLSEIAQASGHGLIVDQAEIMVRPETRAICSLFSIDPFSTSSEGTLLITCRPRRVGALLDRLGSAGIPAWRIGTVLPKEQGVRLVDGGIERTLEPPAEDPFWPALRKALEESSP